MSTATRSGTFRTIIFVGGRPTIAGTFATWRDADDELARMSEYHFVTGGHVEQLVPGFDWCLCDFDPAAE